MTRLVCLATELATLPSILGGTPLKVVGQNIPKESLSALEVLIIHGLFFGQWARAKSTQESIGAPGWSSMVSATSSSHEPQ